MVATAYTIVLWELRNVGFPFPSPLPSPPAGFLWVIRDVTIRYANPGGWLTRPFQASVLVDGQVLVATPAYRTLMSELYEFRNVRQTVNTFNTLQFNALQAGWDTRATGYQLSAP